MQMRKFFEELPVVFETLKYLTFTEYNNVYKIVKTQKDYTSIRLSRRTTHDIGGSVCLRELNKIDSVMDDPFNCQKAETPCVNIKKDVYRKILKNLRVYIKYNDIFSRQLFDVMLSDQEMYSINNDLAKINYQGKESSKDADILIIHYNDLQATAYFREIESFFKLGNVIRESISQMYKILKSTPPANIPLRRTEFNYVTETCFQSYLIGKTLDLYQGIPTHITIKSTLDNLCSNYDNFISGYEVFIKEEDLIKRIEMSRYYMQEPSGRLRSNYVKKSYAYEVKLIKLADSKEEIKEEGQFIQSPHNHKYAESISRVSRIIEDVLYIVCFIEDITNLFCKASLERICYGKQKNEVTLNIIYEYVKRWDAYTEAFQTIGHLFAPISGVFNSIFNSLHNFKCFPVYPPWSVERMMIIGWKNIVLKPLLNGNGILLLIKKLIYDSIINKGCVPPLLKKVINSLFVDLSCNETNVLFLGHSTMFTPDDGLLDLKNALTDLINALDSELITETNSNFVSDGHRLITIIRDVFPMCIEKSILNSITVHMESVSNKRLFVCCSHIYEDISGKIDEIAINPLFIADEMPAINTSGSLANILSRIGERLNLISGKNIDLSTLVKTLIFILKRDLYKEADDYKEIQAECLTMKIKPLTDDEMMLEFYNKSIGVEYFTSESLEPTLYSFWQDFTSESVLDITHKNPKYNEDTPNDFPSLSTLEINRTLSTFYLFYLIAQNILYSHGSI